MDDLPVTFKIAHNVLKYVPFRNQLILRLLSKDWNNAVFSFEGFFKRCTVNVKGDFQGALQVFTASQSSPWESFKFNSPHMSRRTGVEDRFWQMKGGEIKSLIFENHNLNPASFLEIIHDCPNLEELTVRCGQLYSDFINNNNDPNPFNGREDSSQERLELIPHPSSKMKDGVLGNLKSLHILDSNSIPPEILGKFLQWATQLENITLRDKTPHPQPVWDVSTIIQFAETRAKYLTTLDLSGSQIKPKHISALGKIRNLKLKAISFQFATVTEKSLQNFFRKQKFLEEIDVSFTQVSEKAFTHPTCTFQRLRKLNLSGFTDRLEFLSFLSRMPNLDTLNLSGSRSRTMNWEALVAAFPPAKLKNLQCLDLSRNLNLGSFGKLDFFHCLMDSSRQLTCLNLSANVSINDAYLQIIWKTLPRLRILFLEHLTTVSNEGITGIRHSQVQAAEAAGKLKGINAPLLRYQNKEASFIGNCTELQLVSMAYSTRLTDLAIQFGFHYLRKLQKLKLTGCTHISDLSLYYLTMGCPSLSYLDLTGSNKITMPWIDWAKASLPEITGIMTSATPSPVTSARKILA